MEMTPENLTAAYKDWLRGDIEPRTIVLPPVVYEALWERAKLRGTTVYDEFCVALEAAMREKTGTTSEEE